MPIIQAGSMAESHIQARHINITPTPVHMTPARANNQCRETSGLIFSIKRILSDF
jgi:hypothetical protein